MGNSVGLSPSFMKKSAFVSVDFSKKPEQVMPDFLLKHFEILLEIPNLLYLLHRF